jgi:cysteine-rich repeat protein
MATKRSRALAFVVTALAGCSGHAGPATIDCPGGGVCPQAFPKCVLVEMIGPDCGSDGWEVEGGCERCALATCGNGQCDPDEACDDGNNISGDGCPADCRSDDGLVCPVTACPPTLVVEQGGPCD